MGAIAALTKTPRRKRLRRRSEDLTPNEFYGREDAETALQDATFVHRTVLDAVQETDP